MRFRCQIKKVPLMGKIVKSLSSMAKSCIIKLSPEAVHFIVPGSEGGPEGMQIWSQVRVSTLFDQYRVESRVQNTIHLEVASLESLGRALRSAETASPNHYLNRSGDPNQPEEGVVMKLGKKDNQAVLIIDIHGFSSNDHRLEIRHEIAVKVLSPAQVKELKEPMCPTPDIHIQLPPLVQLKGIASKMAHMDSTVTISANLEGAMTFAVKADELELETKWEGLTIPNFNRPPEDAPDGPPMPMGQFHGVQVGLKSLMKFLNTNLSNSVTIACICERFCLIAYVYIGDVAESAGVLTVFIPGKTEAIYD